MSMSDNKKSLITLENLETYHKKLSEQLSQITGVDNIENITYSDLKNLRDDDGLSPGRLYRITDYVTVVNSATNDVRSAGHQFDIIVEALNENTLSEQAHAIWNKSENGRYFDGENLNAWQLWYCLDNDKDRFEWAADNGTGVIYRMIDEYGNDCPYDFKNIIYILDTPIIKGETQYGGDYYLIRNAHKDIILSEKTYYAWDYRSVDGSSTTIWCETTDLTLNTKFYDVNQNVTSEFIITDIITEAYTFGNDCKNNVIKCKCYMNLNRIILGDGCYDNSFDIGCSNINLCSYCDGNSFGMGCHDINFGSYCTYNTFEASCARLNFSHYCNHNTFGTKSEDASFSGGYHDNENIVYDFRSLLLGGIMYGYGSGDSIGAFETISIDDSDMTGDSELTE